MGKQKSGWFYSNHIITPHSLEHCHELLQKQRKPAAFITMIDGDNHQFELDLWGAKLIGTMKRWDTNSTLVMYKVHPKKLNVFWGKVGSIVLVICVGLVFLIIGFILAGLFDGADGSVDGHGADLSGLFIPIGSWDGSMKEVDKIAGDEGKLLRLMRDLFGDEPFHQTSKVNWSVSAETDQLNNYSSAGRTVNVLPAPRP